MRSPPPGPLIRITDFRTHFNVQICLDTKKPLFKLEHAMSKIDGLSIYSATTERQLTCASRPAEVIRSAGMHPALYGEDI
jgi:hypothetical protein